MKYQLFPNLTADEMEALTADIKERGVMVPVELDENGDILDGHHRAMIADSLGIGYPTVVREGWTENQKLVHVVALNAHRRQLSAVERAEVVARLRKEGKSLRAIGKTLGVDAATVHRDLAPVADATPETVTGTDGKSYPAIKPDPMAMTDVHRAKFPHLAADETRVQYTHAMYAFGNPGKFEPEEWADRVIALGPEDIADVQRHLAYIRRWLDRWDQALAKPALSLVGGRAE